MFDAPPPYTGIGPNQQPYPTGQFGGQMYSTNAGGPTAPPCYEQATALPRKE